MYCCTKPLRIVIAFNGLKNYNTPLNYTHATKKFLERLFCRI